MHLDTCVYDSEESLPELTVKPQFSLYWHVSSGAELKDSCSLLCVPVFVEIMFQFCISSIICFTVQSCKELSSQW